MNPLLWIVYLVLMAHTQGELVESTRDTRQPIRIGELSNELHTHTKGSVKCSIRVNVCSQCVCFTYFQSFCCQSHERENMVVVWLCQYSGLAPCLLKWCKPSSRDVSPSHECGRLDSSAQVECTLTFISTWTFLERGRWFKGDARKSMTSAEAEDQSKLTVFVSYLFKLSLSLSVSQGISICTTRVNIYTLPWTF